jgi:uncharacterized protein YgiM (DUF1202 family)
MNLQGKAIPVIGLILLAGSVMAATMSVQVRNGQLRATPSFLGQVVAPVLYGDQVQVVSQQGEWMQVTAPGGQSGWIHKSALTQQHIELKAGEQNVETGASGEELALATKGFNSDVEAEFKKSNKDVDFTWVDRMEKYKVTPAETTTFLREGAVHPAEGGRP